MTIRCLSMLFTGLPLLFNFSAHAAETDVVTSISVSTLSIDTAINDRLTISDDFVTNGSVQNRRRSKVDTSGTEIGITVIEEGFYYGFTTMLTGQSVSDYSSRYTQNHPDFGNRDEFISTPETVSITSYSAYMGTRVADNMRVYGGFTTGKTHAGEEYFFEETGPFIGAQYIIPLDDSSLTLDLSYSVLASEINLKDFDGNDEPYVSVGNQDGYTIDADTTGFSFSMTWLRGLDRGRSYYFRLKFVELDIDNGSVAITGDANATGTAEVSGSKSVSSLALGMGF